MEVPYHASGASFRAQYSLAAILATTPSEAPKQVEAILSKLSTPGLPQQDVKECLLLLMQADYVLASGEEGVMERAFPHAVRLAAAKQMADARVGYVFLQQHMPPSHPIGLLLVNTVCKDLASTDDARIVLALSALMHLPNADAIPAMRPLLPSLLSHHSQHVRRASLGAITKLAELDPSLAEDVLAQGPKILEAGDTAVRSALLGVLQLLVDVAAPSKPAVALLKLLWGEARSPSGAGAHRFRLRVVQLTGALLEREGVSEGDRAAFRAYLMQEHVKVSTQSTQESRAILLALCRAHSFLLDGDSLLILTPVRAVLSQEHAAAPPNDVFWALACLEAIPVELWADVLEEREVKVLVGCLGSKDEGTRRMTLRLFKRADPMTLKLHFQALLDTGRTERAMEAAGIMEDSGHGYTKRLRQVLSEQEDGQRKRTRAGAKAGGVMQNVVEEVLTLLKDRNDAFQAAFTRSILVSLTKSDIGPTLILIASAIACEYAHISGLSPQKTLRAMSSCLGDSSANVQEAVLLALLRLSARCSSNDEDLLQAVHRLKLASGRHIQRRCEQFEVLSADRDTLRRLAEPPSAATLPGFLASVEAHFRQLATPLPTSSLSNTVGPPPSSSPASASPVSPTFSVSAPSPLPGKLRYAPYETTSAPTSVRPNSWSTISGSSYRTRSIAGRSMVGSLHEAAGIPESPGMESTMTPGDIALMEEERGWNTKSVNGHRRSVNGTSHDLETPKPDLIAFDTPMPQSAAAFDAAWREMGDGKDVVARGWCADAPLEVVGRLARDIRGLVSFGEGAESEVRAYVATEPHPAMLICRLGDSGSCLWILKSHDAELRLRMRDLISQEGG